MTDTDDFSFDEGEDRPADTIELLGIKIEHVGPIQRCYLPLHSPFTVLYGLNGAGKSHVLTAAARAFGDEPTLGIQSSAVDTDASEAPNVDVYLRSAGWTLAQTAEPNPWDPWQALWTGTRQYIHSELKGLRDDYHDGVSDDEMALATATHYAIPLLNERLELSLETPTAVRELPFIAWMLADLMLCEDPCAHTKGGPGHSMVFDPEVEVFAPIAEAFLERRLIVSIGRERQVKLGRAQDGPATTDWVSRLRLTIRNELGVPYSLEELELLISELSSDELTELMRLLQTEKEERATPAGRRDDEVSLDSAPDEVGEPNRSESDTPINKAIDRFRKGGAEAFSDELFDHYSVRAHCLQWDSVISDALRLEPPPVWACDAIVPFGDDPGPLPYGLLDESSDGASLATVRTLAERRAARSRDELASMFEKFGRGFLRGRDVRDQRSREPSDPHKPVDLSLLIEQTEGGFAVDPDLELLASELTNSANLIYSALMPGAPSLRCSVSPVLDWATIGPITWTALDHSEVEVRSVGLSAAEHRWAEFSIRLADQLAVREPDRQVIVLIDEPERALHRRAERDLANGLAVLAERHDLRLVVASHSPAFLSHRRASLQHVHRDARGATVIDTIPDDYFDRTRELGLDPTDLLQLSSAFLLVEGQHELVILDELIGDELRRLGIQMLCMRGATSLKAWDAQMIQRYTDVPVVVLVDNDRADRLTDIWRRAQQAARDGDPHFAIIDELKSGARGSEGEFLRELCKNLISGGTADRYSITAFDAPDIPEYLPPVAVAPKTRGKTWAQLRAEAQNKAESSGSFKSWMVKSYGADYSDGALRSAAQQLDSVPQDFVDLVGVLDGVVRRYSAREPQQSD